MCLHSSGFPWSRDNLTGLVFLFQKWLIGDCDSVMMSSAGLAYCAIDDCARAGAILHLVPGYICYYVRTTYQVLT